MDRVSSMLSFVKVVDQGSFASAARNLGLAASVVTTHVKALEERLGVRLLNRTTRSVSLTEAGRAYYERAVQIISELEEADEAAQLLQSKPRGVLRINTSPAIPVLIASAVAEYNDLYPDVTIHLTATSRMLAIVEEGFDMAVWYAASAADPGLIIRRLSSYRLLICASPDYLAKYGRPQHPSELPNHKCIIFYDNTLSKGGREWTFTGPEGDFQVRLSGRIETNSPLAMREAALRGQGFVIAPSPMVCEDLRSGALVSVLDGFLPNELSVDALYPHRAHLPAKVRTFIDVMANNFRHIDWTPCGPSPQRSVKPVTEAILPASPPLVAAKS